MNTDTRIPTLEQMAKAQELNYAWRNLNGSRRHGTKAAARHAKALYTRLTTELDTLCSGDANLITECHRAI